MTLVAAVCDRRKSKGADLRRTDRRYSSEWSGGGGGA
jgi:hypothetical protein